MGGLRDVRDCPSCGKHSLFTHEESKHRECFECGYKMHKITVSDLKFLYFSAPMKIEDGFVEEGDDTNYEFYWAVNFLCASVTGRPLIVAGWQDDGMYRIRSTNEAGDETFVVGRTVEEATENFLRGVLHEATNRRARVGGHPDADQQSTVDGEVPG